MERAAGRPRLGLDHRANLFQHPQSLDLRRLERDSEEHHRESDPRALISTSRSREAASAIQYNVTTGSRIAARANLCSLRTLGCLRVREGGQIRQQKAQGWISTSLKSSDCSRKASTASSPTATISSNAKPSQKTTPATAARTGRNSPSSGYSRFRSRKSMAASVAVRSRR